MPQTDEALVAAVENSPAGWAVIAVALVVIAFVVAKYIIPPVTQSRERVHMRELDIRQKEAENDAARIESNRALAEQVRGLKESNDSVAVHVAEQTARLNESASRSHEMGGKVDHVESMSSETLSLVRDIHKATIPARGEGTD